MQTGTQGSPEDYDRYVADGRREDWWSREDLRRFRFAEMPVEADESKSDEGEIDGHITLL